MPIDPKNPYIKPRPYSPKETEQECLLRRLEEYIEYAHAVGRFADVGFYEKLHKYINEHPPEG